MVLKSIKPSFISQNLKLLRKSVGNSLEDMADLLMLKSKSSYKAYEEGKALPDIHKLMKLASYYDVSLEDLVYRDLSSRKPNSSDSEFQYEIEKVPYLVAAGYAQDCIDPISIHQLEKIKIPFKPYGITRAFEIHGDSMEPEIMDGSIVCGIKINRGELRSNSSYIVVTRNGYLCKKVSIGEDGTIYLISVNTNHPPRHIDNSEDIVELWEVWKIL
jgi:phage repressor protein C with HTH and peptisase S24 domain